MDPAEAIAAREPLFHRPPPRTREEFDALTDPGFWEVGASGAVYDRETVWAVLRARAGAPATDSRWRVERLAVRDLGGVFQATYTLHQGARVTRRCTLWRFDGAWRAVYHQGTLVGNA